MLSLFFRVYRTFFSQPPAPSIPNTKAFPEEHLSLSGKEGAGFFPATPGLLLNDGRYKIVRKLGRGQFSSTWLVSDSQYVHSQTHHNAYASNCRISGPMNRGGTALLKS